MIQKRHPVCMRQESMNFAPQQIRIASGLVANWPTNKDDCHGVEESTLRPRHGTSERSHSWNWLQERRIPNWSKCFSVWPRLTIPRNASRKRNHFSNGHLKYERRRLGLGMQRLL